MIGLMGPPGHFYLGITAILLSLGNCGELLRGVGCVFMCILRVLYACSSIREQAKCCE